MVVMTNIRQNPLLPLGGGGDAGVLQQWGVGRSRGEEGRGGRHERPEEDLGEASTSSKLYWPCVFNT